MPQSVDQWQAAFQARSDEIAAEMRAELFDDIEAFCAKHGITTAEFGRQAVNDRGFFTRLKAGTSPRQVMIARIDAYLEMGPNPERSPLPEGVGVPYDRTSAPA